jgi:hypothetical protein
MSQSYNKPCNTCKQEIRMDQVNGKWAAYDLNGSGFHQCKQKAVVNQGQGQGQQGEPLTMEKLNVRVNRLEKIIDAFLMAGARE